MNSPLAFESALAVLKDTCPELGGEARESLSRLVVERTASLPALKIAGLLMTIGQSPEDALKSAQLLEPHAHTRKVMALFSAYSELRDLVRGGRFYVEASYLLKAVVRKVDDLARLGNE